MLHFKFGILCLTFYRRKMQLGGKVYKLPSVFLFKHGTNYNVTFICVTTFLLKASNTFSHPHKFHLG
jgi:hypothetical protein